LRGNRGVFKDNVVSTRRFARIISRHECLKELCLAQCQIGHEGIRIILDSLHGNTTLDMLRICHEDDSDVSSSRECLPFFTRLLESSTRLKTIAFNAHNSGYSGLFADEDSTRHFTAALQHKNSTVEALPGFRRRGFSFNSRAASASIENSLRRNQQLNRVALLLAPPPPPPPPPPRRTAQQQQQQQQQQLGNAAPPAPIQQQQQQQQLNAAATTMMLKISHKAISKFAMVPNSTGASAIFKLFTARPQLLEKHLQRPPGAAATAAAATAAVTTTITTTTATATTAATTTAAATATATDSLKDAYCNESKRSYGRVGTDDINSLEEDGPKRQRL
jgi:hypothetical protein